jgi:hypothetical protein
MKINISPKGVPLRVFIAGVITTAAACQASTSLFTAGDLVVNTYGILSGYVAPGALTPINLIEYSPTGGAAVLTYTLPTADGVAGAANVGVVGQYDSNSEGNIQLSADGSYLTLAGYSATAAAAGIQKSTNTANGTNYPAGTAYSFSTVAVAQSTDTDVPRVVAFVDPNGNVNSSTLLNDVYSTNNPRAVYSASPSTFYISGQGDGNTTDQGVYFAQTGMNTVAHPSPAPAGIYNAHETRTVSIYNNNLYYSIDTSSGKYTGIWKFNGTPTGPATATRIIPANNGLTGASLVSYSPEAFYFANPTTLYVADTGLPKFGGVGDGGIQKWVFSGSSWTLAYTLIPSANFSNQYGFQDLTGEVVGSGATAQVTLFGVSNGNYGEAPNGLFSITDSLAASSAAGESFTLLESSAGGGGLNFKGVAFAPVAIPEPTSLAVITASGASLLLRRNQRHKKRTPF